MLTADSTANRISTISIQNTDPLCDMADTSIRLLIHEVPIISGEGRAKPKAWCSLGFVHAGGLGRRSLSHVISAAPGRSSRTSLPSRSPGTDAHTPSQPRASVRFHRNSPIPDHPSGSLFITNNGNLDSVDGNVGFEPSIDLGIKWREETVLCVVTECFGLGHCLDLSLF